MSDQNAFPPAAAAAGFPGLIALAETFTRIVRAETEALRRGERQGFEALTARKGEYHAVLQDSMAALAPRRDQATPQEREAWRKAAAEAEAALQENAKLIAGEQLQTAAMLDMLRDSLRRNSIGYGPNARLKPRS